MTVAMYGGVFFRTLGLVALVVLFQGCSQPPPAPLQGCVYLQRAPIKLRVAHIKILLEEGLHEAATPPDLLPMPLSLFLRQWAKESFVAVGSQGVLRFTMQEARIQEVVMPHDASSRPQEAYKGIVHVSFKLQGASFPSCEEHTIVLEQTLPVPLSATLADRRALAQLLCENLVNKLTFAVEKKLKAMGVV